MFVCLLLGRALLLRSKREQMAKLELSCSPSNRPEKFSRKRRNNKESTTQGTRSSLTLLYQRQMSSLPLYFACLSIVFRTFGLYVHSIGKSVYLMCLAIRYPLLGPLATEYLLLFSLFPSSLLKWQSLESNESAHIQVTLLPATSTPSSSPFLLLPLHFLWEETRIH